MSTVAVVVIVIVAVLVIAGAGYLAWRQRQRHRLRERFGPEYDRTVERHSSTREAEQELRAREQRHDELPIRPLDPQVRDRYRADWQRLQEKFVDAPAAAVTEADDLLIRVMNERGYPTEDFEQRVADLSVEHAATIDRYRTAHDIRGRAETNLASTEDLRRAMVHYRALFAELLGDETTDGTTDRRSAGTVDDGPGGIAGAASGTARADASTASGASAPTTDAATGTPAAPIATDGPAGAGEPARTQRGERAERAEADRRDAAAAEIGEDGRDPVADTEAGESAGAAGTGRPGRRTETAGTDGASVDGDRADSGRAVAGRERDLSKGRRR